jgi:hypothetical protein
MIGSTVACALMAVLQTLSAGPELALNGNESARPEVCGADVSETANHPGFRAMRIIEDPATHRRWLLERNVDHPARPALLTAITRDRSCSVRSFQQREKRDMGHGSQVLLPMVHAGDALVVVEDTQSWHVEMEAVALTPGSPGDSIMVRLRIGGKVTRATVISKRRAVAANGFEVYR